MKVSDLVFGPVTPASLLVVLLVVGGVTSLNVYLNPPPPEVEGEPPQVWFYVYIENLAWRNYTRYDIDCWYPEGMTLEELGSGGEPNAYSDGGLHGYGDPNNPSGEFYLMWKPSGTFKDWGEALDYISRVSGVEVTYGEIPEEETQYPSWQDHVYVIMLVNGTGRYVDEYVGIYLAQECTETDRTILYLYVDLYGFAFDDYTKNGAVYGATFRCHPYSGTPLDDIIGYPYGTSG
ncbi:hypothetical protein JXL21_08285 [Candidatus Bathyarchaeota archaeon]|nr:hypothetical protein [Candidatus Bathyarchaeota archaeon]